MQSKSATVCVIGLGYVGLPLAIQFARCGAKVIGLDVDAAKVEQINAGHSYIKHIASETIAETLRNDQLRASTDFARVSEGDAVIICVPTPLNKNREPDISLHSGYRPNRLHRTCAKARWWCWSRQPIRARPMKTCVE